MDDSCDMYYTTPTEDSMGSCVSEHHVKIRTKPAETESETSCKSLGHQTENNSKPTNPSRNAYMNFYLELIKDKKFQGVRVTEVAKYAGCKWSNMSDEMKKPYYKLAEDAPKKRTAAAKIGMQKRKRVVRSATSSESSRGSKKRYRARSSTSRRSKERKQSKAKSKSMSRRAKSEEMSEDCPRPARHKQSKAARSPSQTSEDSLWPASSKWSEAARSPSSMSEECPRPVRTKRAKAKAVRSPSPKRKLRKAAC
uniref:HMG box domain-containing protein n=1 Tax=Cacopsylla melanoneura TaxID=428564 RepID=A0A8D8XFF7_9HEMI